MDTADLAKRLQALNDLRRNGQFDTLAIELDALGDLVRPDGLAIMLVKSPYGEAYPTVYAALSQYAEEH